MYSLCENHMVFIPSWHDHAPFNQKCQDSFYATPRVVHLLHNTCKVNSGIHLQYGDGNESFYLSLYCMSRVHLHPRHSWKPYKVWLLLMYMQLKQHEAYPSSMFVVATFIHFSGGSLACIWSVGVNNVCVITPYFGSVERVSCFRDTPASNSAMSDWGAMDAGSHVISCLQPTQATYRKQLSVSATQKECSIRLLLVCYWFHTEDTITVVLVLISWSIYDKVHVHEIWRMEHVKQYIPILPDSRLYSLLSFFQQWLSQLPPHKKGQHFHHRGQTACLHVGHDRNSN